MTVVYAYYSGTRAQEVSPLGDISISKWILEFLERDGLGALLECLERLTSTRVGHHQRDEDWGLLEACVAQLQCVGCIRSLINSKHGVQYLVDNRAYARQLINGM
ncbi:hypothetical protein AAG570_004723 [Ranatra chinensis]|uniref:Formin GTPase-binding domain-containing protein n=1 Tax=Ranatra chinensis TaxID=642074 RepID=A0ABD0Y1N2_9HEMI